MDSWSFHPTFEKFTLYMKHRMCGNIRLMDPIKDRLSQLLIMYKNYFDLQGYVQLLTNIKGTFKTKTNVTLGYIEVQPVSVDQM